MHVRILQQCCVIHASNPRAQPAVHRNGAAGTAGAHMALFDMTMHIMKAF